ncbi:MAG: hypothetical protein JOS17DRAFT_746772 [Linnemannia elongata]|nr:MAG: hypothetical protein JOS17DRAFT_746772 [Linnemannia elongata]
MSTTTFTCTDCSPVQLFETSDQLRNHNLEYHGSVFSVTVTSDDGSLQKHAVSKVNDLYVCPLGCGATFRTKSGGRKHLVNRICIVKDVKEEEDLPDPGLPIRAMPKHLPVPSPPTSDPLPTIRAYRDAVLYSCQHHATSHVEQQRTLDIIDALGLKPFALKDALGVEQNALAHASVIAKLSAGQVSVCPTTPHIRKRRYDEDEAALICLCSPVPTPGLEHILSVSPYTALLVRRKFVELDDHLCELLNRDWEFSPHLRYACAKALAGCIIFNTKSCQAVIANTVEVFGRTKLVDVHRESFVVRKGQPVATSLPPSTRTPYLNVWPKTLSSPEGERLVIGTRSFNALITSSLRLDTKMEASVGGTTLSFLLSSTQDSLATKIFLDAESVHAALELAKDEEAWSVSASDLICQLRQVKTHFDDPSTYYLHRASSDFAANHPCQPYTVFSLASFDQAHSGDGVAASRIFRLVANMVIKAGADAKLTKPTVVELRGRCTKSGDIAQEFDGILSLYSEDQSSIPILGNKDLNKHLEKMARCLSSYIATANKSVVSFIDQEFTSSAM